MEETDRKDQAESLRAYTEQGNFKEEVSALDLPPRSEVHNQKQKKAKWRLNTLWIRFLFLIFIIIISLFLTYSYWDEWFGRSDSPVIVEEQQLHDEVEVQIEP
ncbi:hypothetical protein [Halobacillus salinus]|uniref:hypothetical protein n=1 Tax=Halobacillus salinus TaxID=192814 RepID=UPI0009A5F5F2|nr:hypothetical protein [Halobacillus salinus]